MICDACRKAGDANAVDKWYTADKLHAECTGPGCTCQHGTGNGWVARGATRS
jgi:hypothetical protein